MTTEAIYRYTGTNPEYVPNRFDIVGGFPGHPLDELDQVVVVGGAGDATTLDSRLVGLFRKGKKKGGDDILYSCPTEVDPDSESSSDDNNIMQYMGRDEDNDIMRLMRDTI